MRGELELAAYTDDEPPPGGRVEDVEPGWEERWREFHRPVRVGPFWIGPPWEQPRADVVPVVIDPGRAFGTGAHATTQLCVELVAELEPASLLDLGCGSGVIAIAAALLGLAPVIAVDVDPAAVDATRATPRANGVAVDARKLDARRTRCPTPTWRSRTSRSPSSRPSWRALGARVVVASGFLERDEPRAGSTAPRAPRRGGWAADLLERSE